MKRWGLQAIAAALVIAAAGGTMVAQRGWGGFEYAGAAAYDGKFIFVRMSYPTGFRREPRWAHDYPVGEQNFMKILTAVSNVPAHTEVTSVLPFSSPEIFKFPLLYLVEPGDWQLQDAEVESLRSYLLKGGFLIVDDFPYWAWNNFELQMGRVFPKGRWIELDITHPIFDAFFEIPTLDIVPAYPALGPRPMFMAMFEDNDPTKRMYAIANYQNDLSEFWEHSVDGPYPVDASNEAYKIGVNEFIYGITH